MDGESVSPLDLPPKIQKSSPAGKIYAKVPTNLDLKNFYEAVEEFEQSFLQEKYSLYEGNVSKMAAALEMDRSYLHGKLKNFGIHSIRKLNQ